MAAVWEKPSSSSSEDRKVHAVPEAALARFVIDAREAAHVVIDRQQSAV